MLRDIFLMSRPPLLRKEGNAAAAKVVGNSFTGSMTPRFSLIPAKPRGHKTAPTVANSGETTLEKISLSFSHPTVTEGRPAVRVLIAA